MRDVPSPNLAPIRSSIAQIFQSAPQEGPVGGVFLKANGQWTANPQDIFDPTNPPTQWQAQIREPIAQLSELGPSRQGLVEHMCLEAAKRLWRKVYALSPSGEPLSLDVQWQYPSVVITLRYRE